MVPPSSFSGFPVVRAKRAQAGAGLPASLAFRRENAIALRAGAGRLLGGTFMAHFGIFRHRALAPANASAMRRNPVQGGSAFAGNLAETLDETLDETLTPGSRACLGFSSGPRAGFATLPPEE